MTESGSDSARVSSIQWAFNGARRIDGAAPWSLCGNRATDFFACDRLLVIGTVATITATPYSGSNATGMAGETVSVELSIIKTGTPIATLDFTLINADSDTDISLLVNDTVIDLAKTPRVNVRANVEHSMPGCVQFMLNGRVIRVENGAPYALFANNGPDYFSWTPPVGNHVMTATVYTERNAQGSIRAASSVTFVVTNNPVAPVVAPSSKPVATSVAPALAPKTRAPVISTQAPVAVTKAPATAAAPASTTPTLAPVRPPTRTPISKSPTRAPVRSPTRMLVRPPTRAPTIMVPPAAPVPFPAFAPTNAVGSTPPRLLDLKLWTPTVDVSNGPAEAILQITAQDDNSGLALSQWSATIGQFGSVSSDYWPPTPTAGTVSDFNVTLQFGPYIAPSPTYQLNAMIRDVADNVVFFDSLQLAALGFSSTIAIVNTNPDVQAPKVFNFSATTPTKVNASSTAPVKVSFAIEVEDTMFGTKSIRLQAVDKGLRTYASDVIFNSPPVVGRRTCTLTLEFAANPKPMVYNLLLGVADEGWNSMAYDANALSKLGFPSIVQVVSAVDKADVTAPILLNLTALSPLVVNYSATFPPEVNFELSALDDQSGIWVACLRASHINETLSACRGEIRTPITHVFYERPRFLFNPKAWGCNPAFWREKPGSFRGVYNLSVYLRDDVDNEMTISSDELVARGFPGSFTVV